MNIKELEKIMESAAAVSYVDDARGQACITLLQLDLILQEMILQKGGSKCEKESGN